MRDKSIWIFNAGNSFSGNPKWLFLHITRHHPEITAYWFCYSDELVSYMKQLGYHACKFNTSKAIQIGEKAGVYVVEQNKEKIQHYLQGIVILNLWHGVGCKKIEKAVNEGWMTRGIAKKRILNNLYYKRDSLYLVTSPLMEEHFKTQCDIDDDKVIRAGYPRCETSEQIHTYDHNILGKKRLGPETRIALYAPTFRDYNKSGFFPKAFPDIQRLIDALEVANYLLIIKVHPQMEKDYYYNNLKAEYSDSKRLFFWDNRDDIYEMMTDIDLGIIDYSSIFYDMVAMGVPHYIRYPFDIDEGAVRDFAYDYYEMTCGTLCNSFDELIHAISDGSQEDHAEDIQRIKELFWEYANPGSCETLFERAMSFEPDENYVLPTLYSFDIFDTLLGRTTLGPRGVFRYVQDRMRESGAPWPNYFVQNYFKIRPWAEQNCREYMNKTVVERDSDKCEITLDMIYERMAVVYSLDDAQICQLKEWEIEGEVISSIPYEDNIERALELKQQGETVVLISDMYLPKEVVQRLLEKNNPELLELPLYLSCEYGHQKSKGSLYLDVYHDLDYCFAEWVHCGDNGISDVKMPRQIGITCERYLPIPAKLGKYETNLIQFADIFDVHQVAALFTRFETLHKQEMENIFAYCYASLYFVPYIEWVIEHAISKGTQCLIFIARDGYLLKIAADALIEARGYPIKTKYLFGSRKAWRVPSQISEIDTDFFGGHGNFTGVEDFSSLLEAAKIESDEFDSLFPEFVFLRASKKVSKKEIGGFVQFLKNSKRYHALLLKKAEQERVLVNKYLAQEIDFSEKNAFVEYWARGYTQICLANLIEDYTGKSEDCVFYYSRSIYPSQDGYKRYNYTTNTRAVLFVEALFANVPYTSTKGYRENDGIIEPIIEPCNNNSRLMKALEAYLPAFVSDYVKLPIVDYEYLGRSLYDFGLSYFHKHQTDPVFLQCIAPLPYSQTIYGDPLEYAPKLAASDAIDYLSGSGISTQSKTMSIARSDRKYKFAYRVYNKVKNKNSYKLAVKMRNKIKKRFLHK